MANEITFKLELTNFQKFARFVNRKQFERLMAKHVGRATWQNAATLQKRMRRVIQTRKGLAGNALLTQRIKGSNKPLADKGDLFTAITSKKLDTYTSFAGVLRTNEGFNVAEGLHEGMNLKVTDKMRNMFRYLWMASEGAIDPSRLTGRAAELWDRKKGSWRQLNGATTVLKVPGRPFVTIALQSNVQQMAARNWNNAMKLVWRDMARKVGKVR